MDKKSSMKEVLDRLSAEIGNIDQNGRNLVVWGAGNTARLCQESFRRHKIDPLFYIDSNTEKQKRLFYGYKVLSPDALDEIDDPTVLISSGNVGFTEEIQAELRKKGLRNFTVDEYILGKNADRLIKIADMLNDRRSVEVYCDMILNRLNNRFPDPDTVSGDQYFALPCFQNISPDDVFVNIGAYKGEEIEKYLGYCDGKKFGKIISFEPDKDSYTELLALVNDLNRKWGIEDGKMRCVMAAIGDVTRTIGFRFGEGLGSTVDETLVDSASTIDVYSLDDFMPNDKVDFLKADIESFELKMLHGAKNTIIRNTPRIAVCIYHSPADLFDIIEYLSDLNLGYSFSVRHHSDTFVDTVLYAYAEKK